MSVFSVAAKRVLVTGGARGIGASCARALFKAGANVVMLDVLRAEGSKLAKDLSAIQPKQTARFIEVDVRDSKAVSTAVQEAVDKLGGLDAVVNCAGVERNSPAEDLSSDTLNLILDINTKGSLFVSQAAFPHLKSRGGGTVLFMGSDGGLIPTPGLAAYAMSKGAIHSLTRSLATEWGRHGIRVNSVLPLVWTPMFEAHNASLDPEALARQNEVFKTLIPLGGQLGDADSDLAPVVQFLISDASKFITAQLISVNGGSNSVR